MSNPIVKRQILPRMLLLGLFVHAGWSPAPAHAESNTETAGLKPETREAVRSVGRALLQAKRSYTPAQGTTALRDNVERVRRMIMSLIAPISTNTPIKIAKAGAGAVTSQALSVTDDWQQAHADDIQQLNTATSELRQQCQTLRREMAPTTPPRSLINSVITFFTGAPTVQATTKPAVITPVTSVALTRLEQVESDVTEALKLPTEERNRQLKLLAVTLKIGDRQAVIDDDQQEQQIVSPTLTSRTQHRQD